MEQRIEECAERALPYLIELSQQDPADAELANLIEEITELLGDY